MRWPERAAVHAAVTAWAADLAARRPDVQAVGYFGSLARPADWGVGSDADLLVVLDATDEPFEHRDRNLDTTGLPVPADLLVYTADEWVRTRSAGPFHERVRREAVWVYRRPET